MNENKKKLSRFPFVFIVALAQVHSYECYLHMRYVYYNLRSSICCILFVVQRNKNMYIS